jgi:putative cell wall-binding protein/Tol biopolymer transport system component
MMGRLRVRSSASDSCALILACVLFVVATVTTISVEPLSAPAAPLIELVSVSSDGTQANSASDEPCLSADGRHVAFESYATNIVTGDNNGAWDVFVHDRTTGESTRVSVSSAGEEANDASYNAAVSADGRYVAFDSIASNLVAGDENAQQDVFVHDRHTGATTRVSVSSAGDEGDGGSSSPSISADGRFVAFMSWASNLVPGDNNHMFDVFVHDRDTGATTRVSVSSAGDEGDAWSYNPSISADGQFVAFQSQAGNLVAGDSNHVFDVFVHDRDTLETTRVSLSSAGAEGAGASLLPSISSGGRYVAFYSGAPNLVAGDTNGKDDVFVHDRTTGETTRVSVGSLGEQGDGTSFYPSISGDGRQVAFYSAATNLVPGDVNSVEDVFVHDRMTGATTRTSVNSAGEEANDWSWRPCVSGDGLFVTFFSRATNLVAGDTNGFRDVFVRGLPRVSAYSVAGLNRFQTAVAASALAYPDGLTAGEGQRFVVLATGRNWPDALGGSALAGVLDAPVLLTEPGSLPAVVLAEIRRLRADRAVILGGTGAVGAEVEEALRTELGSADGVVERIEGKSRYETADAVAQRVISVRGASFGGTAFVATGGSFPDALAAAPLAAAQGWPIYLADPRAGLSAGTVKAMAPVDRVLILGGTGAVDATTERVLKDALGDGNVERLAGDDRYKTAVAVAVHSVDVVGHSWDRVGIATGEDYPDALAGGVLQGGAESVLLLTTPSALTQASHDALVAHRNGIETVTFLGGYGVVSPGVRKAVLQAVE